MITSNDNKKIKHVISLLSKSRERQKDDAYVIEGPRMFSEVRAEDILEVYVSESYKGTCERLREIPYETVSDSVFKSMSDTLAPQGILCVAKRQHYDIDKIIRNNPKGLFVLLENVQDPGNLGTIMRTSEGAGVDLVIMSKDTVDLYNPKVVRSTMGSIFRQPFAVVDDIGDVVLRLRNAGITCYAAHLEGSVDYATCDYKKGTCFFIGNEGNGLTDETTKMADRHIRIPMGGKLESLNAAVSAAVLVYEANRQRR